MQFGGMRRLRFRVSGITNKAIYLTPHSKELHDLKDMGSFLLLVEVGSEVPWALCYT